MILERIKELCKERNISIRKLEQETDINRGTVNAWGRVEPGVEKLQKVANYFGVTLDDLVKGKG